MTSLFRSGICKNTRSQLLFVSTFFSALSFLFFSYFFFFYATYLYYHYFHYYYFYEMENEMWIRIHISGNETFDPHGHFSSLLSSVICYTYKMLFYRIYYRLYMNLGELRRYIVFPGCLIM